MAIELEGEENDDSSREVLIADYTVLREDQHALDQVSVNLFSVAIALISAIAVLLLRSCAGAEVDRCAPVIWAPLYAALPLGQGSGVLVVA